jgi:hypothetical protein
MSNNNECPCCKANETFAPEAERGMGFWIATVVAIPLLLVPGVNFLAVLWLTFVFCNLIGLA